MSATPSTPTTPTEAHDQLIDALSWAGTTRAQKRNLIAESEARAVEVANTRADCLQREVDRWTKWNTEQPWLAEIRGYSQQVASLTAERDALRERIKQLEGQK